MSYDLFSIGNALVDSEFEVEEQFLDEQELTKGMMHLIDLNRIMELREELPVHPVKQQCGGSAANTAYTARALGCEVFFAGKVANDERGCLFKRELDQIGISTLETREHNSDEATGQCIVLVTRDAERTMNTCLSISNSLHIDDLDEMAVTNSRHVYIEGYLASSTTGHAAANRVRELADDHRCHTSINLSDTSMVDGFRTNLETMLGNGVERLFCNSDEALHWCKTDRVDIAVNELRDVARLPVITLGPDGCVVGNVRAGKHVKGFKAHALDVNGAGDMFAGSYLAAIIQGVDEIDAARFGNYAAAQLVETFGSRFDSVDAYQTLQQNYQSRVKGIW